MKTSFQPDFKGMNDDGFPISKGQPLYEGPTLVVRTFEEKCNAVSDLVTLSKYCQIEFRQEDGKPSTYLATSCLTTNPHIYIGDHVNGDPILVGITNALEGNGTIIGQSRSGKTIQGSNFAFQANRLGYAVVVIGLKCVDPLMMSSLKLAADSPTRLTDDGQPATVPFAYFSLQPGVRTLGFNSFVQKRASLPKWLLASNLLTAIGNSPEPGDSSAAYFRGYAQKFLMNISDWGCSFTELRDKIAKMKLDKDTLYATAGIRNLIEQQAALEVGNLPGNHPSNIDLSSMISQKAAVYFDVSYQEIGQVAVAASAIIAQSVVFCKRRLNVGRENVIFLIIDEAQVFAREILKNLIEQAGGSGIRVILIYHNLEQFADCWETLSMTQIRIITGAVPGTVTDRHLQSLFGTKKTCQVSFSISDGTSTSYNISDSGLSYGEGTNSGTGFSFCEVEEQVWNGNDTLALNYNKKMFVFQGTPGAEYTQYGPKAILCERRGTHVPFNQIRKVTAEVLENTKNAFLPGDTAVKQIAAPEVSPEQKSRTDHLGQILSVKAAQIQQNLKNI